MNCSYFIIFIVFIIILFIVICYNRKSKFSSLKYSHIPKTIYMCHKSIQDIQKYSLNWKRLNPDYEIKLFDDTLCKQFLHKEYGKLYVDIFDYIKDGPIKADFWRLCILYKYGGFYIDADIEPLVPLKDFIDNDDYFVTCISDNFTQKINEWRFNPHFIGCHKNNYHIKEAIDKYIKMYKNNKKYSYWKWSVCVILTLDDIYIENKKSQVLNYKNKKYKFLLEGPHNINDPHNYLPNENYYNNKLVFKNRYDNYNNHTFN